MPRQPGETLFRPAGVEAQCHDVMMSVTRGGQRTLPPIYPSTAAGILLWPATSTTPSSPFTPNPPVRAHRAVSTNKNNPSYYGGGICTKNQNSPKKQVSPCVYTPYSVVITINTEFSPEKAMPAKSHTPHVGSGPISAAIRTRGRDSSFLEPRAQRTFLFLPPVLQRLLLLPVGLSLLVHLSPLLLFLL